MSPRRLYLDNAATSFPKPPKVLAAMTHYMREVGASAGRGAPAGCCGRPRRPGRAGCQRHRGARL